MKQNPNDLYEKISKESGASFWGKIPRSYIEAANLTKSTFTPNSLLQSELGTQKFNLLIDILTRYHKKLGIYSPKVGENLQLLRNGSVLTGQQPIIFGGPGLIANKLGLVLAMVDMLDEVDLPLAPVFFVGDYDGMQKELARQYFPNPISHNAHIIDSEEFLEEESSLAAHSAPLPPIEWLYDQITKLDDNFRGFKKQVKGPSKLVIQERWAHIKTILKTSFKSTSTLSEWSTKIWGTVTNVVNDFGIIYLPTSHPEVRELIAGNYFTFIEKRHTYTDVFQKSMDSLNEQGYFSTLPHRHEDYAPFTLECAVDKNRITTTLRFDGDTIYAEGTCPECAHTVSYNVSSKEKLQDIATIIGPRVDTSQAVFQELMNIRIRISGPGEIAYYALAAPSVKAVGFNIPIFVKYTRAFYNSPWIEKLGKQLASRNHGSIHQDTLFTILKERMNGIKNANIDEIQNAEIAMKEFILDQYNKLLAAKPSIDNLKYLGWQYGRFTKQKFAQEVSWVWFDMAIQTGIVDYISTYRRLYTEHSLIGGMYYINSMV
ncbi:MAG: bacillithiol biosynthesis BshC [Candidatus Heimdallarchaeota archaeon]|nr:bacillithiol biosynthesis BshC [Candidatus Heimdallarchaeota archaeon]